MKTKLPKGSSVKRGNELPEYNSRLVKSELPYASGLDFEIHNDYTLIAVKTRVGNPDALIRVIQIPSDTDTLIRLIRACYRLLPHTGVEIFTLTRGNDTFTMDIIGSEVSMVAVAAANVFGIDMNHEVSTRTRNLLALHGECKEPWEPRVNSNLSPVEWEVVVEELDQEILDKTVAAFSTLENVLK